MRRKWSYNRVRTLAHRYRSIKTGQHQVAGSVSSPLLRLSHARPAACLPKFSEPLSPDPFPGTQALLRIRNGTGAKSRMPRHRRLQQRVASIGIEIAKPIFPSVPVATSSPLKYKLSEESQFTFTIRTQDHTIIILFWLGSIDVCQKTTQWLHDLGCENEY